MPTIYDIAKKTGYSPATVSKVFNNYSDVSKRTREKILRVAEEMGYVPNLSARSLKTNKSYLVGVVFSENVGIGLEHQFFSVILESFRKTIGSHGYDTIFINNTLGDKRMGYLDHCKFRNVDGAFILTAYDNDEDVARLLASDIKCVTTDILYKDVPVVMSDNVQGARDAVKYLFDRGHKSIAHLAGPQDTLAGTERLAGYKEMCNELGLNESAENIEVSELFEYEESYIAAKRLLEREDRPTAVFASADIMAIGLIDALKDAGLKVPGDISVVGFDDVLVAKYSTPKITTVRQDQELIGATVADLLFRRMNGEEIDSVPRLPVKIMERDSVRKL